MKTNPNDPAFGHPHVNVESGGFDYTEDGITKREYFAAAALPAVVASLAKIYDEPTIPYAARLAVAMADALLVELSK
jgi:hypothetical protein